MKKLKVDVEDIAMIMDNQDRFGTQYYLDTFELIDFVLDPEGDEGIHAEARRLSDNKIFILPLDYLKVKPRRSKNFSLIDDYGVWFVNYR
jgi:hypothetical protein